MRQSQVLEEEEQTILKEEEGQELEQEVVVDISLAQATTMEVETISRAEATLIARITVKGVEVTQEGMPMIMAHLLMEAAIE